LASRSADLRRIGVLAACAICALSLALADRSWAQLPPLPGEPPPPPPNPSPGSPGPPSSKVRVGSTGASAEIPETLPIRRHPGRGSKVVISLRPGDLPGLQSGDQLEVTAEVEVTTDCLRRTRTSSECRGKAYRFNPRVGATLILADSQNATTGLPLSERQQVTCRQKLPARQHHCYMALAPPPFLVSDESALPCGTNSCHVNLVMEASHRLARRGTVLLIGGNNESGNVQQGKGSVDAVRTRPPDPSQVPSPPPLGTTTHVTSERVATRLSLGEPPRKTVVYSQRLDDLEKGEQLAVRATMITGIKQLRHNAKISSRIVLADNPLDRDPGVTSADASSEEGEITESNGFNCTQRTTPCTTIKSGVLEIEEDVSDALYVNLTLSVGRVGGRAPGDNLVTIQEGGSLEVVRFPAAQKG
jgi:hypothetical protein